LVASTSGASVPAIARLPSSVVPKRTPSSSPKPITSIAKGSFFFCLFKASTHSMALITPSMPSYLPASRTVSRCEPSMRQGSPARCAFVAADRVAHRVERGLHARLAHPAEHRFAAARPSGERKTRVKPPAAPNAAPAHRSAA
jgi:hypothetical protein